MSPLRMAGGFDFAVELSRESSLAKDLVPASLNRSWSCQTLPWTKIGSGLSIGHDLNCRALDFVGMAEPVSVCQT